MRSAARDFKIKTLDALLDEIESLANDDSALGNVGPEESILAAVTALVKRKRWVR